MADREVAVVTGVSSGIGEATARALEQAGYRVFGTVRSLATAVPDGVERVLLDVRDDQSVRAGVKAILEKTGRIDALVNNAGVSLVAAIEETETAQAQDLFDVNFFGAVRMTQAVLSPMRAQNRGRIAFVSSILGFLPGPYLGFYTASKHALEGYSESLDHEVRGFGIRAFLIEPGFTKSKLDQSAARPAQGIADYAVVRERMGAIIRSSIAGGDDPALVANTVVAALRAPNPKLRYPVGKGAGTLSKLRSLMPAGMFDRSFRKQYKLDGAL